MKPEQQFKDQLRTAGQRITAPRLAIFRSLLHHAPLSMAKIIKHTQTNGIDQVTVYRTLDLFRKLELVHEIGLGRNRLFELSDDYHAHHHHFTCAICGTMYDFDSQTVEASLESIAAEHGFKLKSHQLEAIGTCVNCGQPPT